jgi:hypothetical protein
MHKIVFSWGVALELVKYLVKAEGGRTPRMGTRTGNLGNWPGPSLFEVCLADRPVNQQ